MPVEFHEWGGFCKYCDQNRLFRSATHEPNHVVHAIFTVVTSGLWGLVWVIVASNDPKRTPWRCSTCGTPFDDAESSWLRSPPMA